MKDEKDIRSYIKQIEESTALLYDKRKELYPTFHHNEREIDELDTMLEYNEGIVDALNWVIGKKDSFDWY